MNYTRLTIDTLKEAVESIKATGKANDESLGNAIIQLKIGIDAATVKGEPTADLEQYVKDLEGIRYQA